MVNDNLNMIAMVSDVISVISEVNMVGSNTVIGGLILGLLVMCVLIRVTSEKELKSTNFVLSKKEMNVGKGYALNAGGMSIEDLVVRLRIRIKENTKLAQKNTYTPNYSKANMVEHASLSSKTKSKVKGKGKGKVEYLALEVGIVIPHQTNMVNDNLDMIAMVFDVIAMISEVNLWLTMEKSCKWATLQLLISRAKEMLSCR
ncbi:hypothetical protein Tco_0255555 [Tanacetum coccineum]